MVAADPIDVEVAYALPDRQCILKVRVPAGTSAVDAVRASGILRTFPEIDLATAKLGIFGRCVQLSHTVRDADRIEIYRPLTADPKVVRRERAKRRAGAARERGRTVQT